MARRLTHSGPLDGLRGLAVLLVLMRHSFELVPNGFGPSWLNAFLNGGFFGVDIFFVLSGFLITSLLLDERAASGTVRMRNFYGRRFLRLMPALVVMLIVFSIVAVLDGASWASLWPTVRSSLLYYQNWHSVWDADHLAADLGHLWSLSIEEQFYIVWPVILLVVLALWKRTTARVAALAVGVLWVAWYRLHVWNSGVGWAYVFVRTDTRVDALLVGCLVAFVFQMGIVRDRAVNALAWAGAGIVLLTVARTNPTTAYLYQGGLTLGALGVGCVVLAIAEGKWSGMRPLNWRPLRSVGKVSYGLYLWHFPVFRILARHSDSWNSGIRLVVGLLLSGVVTTLSWRLVERPALRLKEKWFARRVDVEAASEEVELVPPSSEHVSWATRAMYVRQRGTRMLLAIVVGAGVTTMFTNIWPEKPLPMTDRMGYALVYNFPLGRYWQVFLLWMTLFPAVVFAIYIVAPRILGRSERSQALVGKNEPLNIRIVESGDDAGVPESPMFAWRVVLVGGVFGYECALAAGRQSGNGWWLVGVGALAYIALVYGFARLFRRSLGVVNLFCTSFVLVGAWWVTSTTEIIVASTGLRREFVWLPLPLVLFAVAALVVSDVFRGKGNYVKRERQRLTFVVVPVFLFLWTSHLPNTVGYIDIFHNGESLNGGWLMQSGWVPWRDFFFNIGFYGAALAPRLSFGLFGTSYWGFSAGTEILLIPLLVVSVYVSCAALASRYWMALVGLTVTLMFPFTAMGGFTKVLAGDPMLFVYRFSWLAPLVIAVLLFIRKTSVARALFFGAALMAAVIASSEMVVFAVAACVTVFLRDVVTRNGVRISMRNTPVLFRSTMYAAGGVLVAMFTTAVVLWRYGALRGYVNWWRIFPFKWYIETGIPMTRWPTLIEFSWGSEWTLLFVVTMALLAVTWLLVWRFRSRQALLNEDWVAVALALGNILFMQKTLNRPDSHFSQSLIVCMPLLFYVIVRTVGTVGDTLQAVMRGTAHKTKVSTVAFMVLTVAIVFPFMTTADVLSARVNNAGTRLQPVTAQPVEFPRMGYSQEGEFLDNYRQLRQFLRKNIGMSAKVYDFSNMTTVYNFLLNKKPLTRFSYVLQASTVASQAEVVATLARERPEVVSYGWDSALDEWDDVANSVRHWSIAEYILRNYSPWKTIGGKNFANVLFLRNDIEPGEGMPLDAVPAQKGAEKAEALRGLNSCNWGVSSNFLTFAPTKPGTKLKVESVQGMLTVFGWAYTKDDEATRIVVKYEDEVVFSGMSSSERPDLAVRGVTTGKLSGFRFDIPVTSGINDTSKVALSQVSPLGVESDIPPVQAAGVNDLVGEFGVQIDQSPDGRLQVGAFRKYVDKVTLPKNRMKATWLVASSEFGFSNDNFVMYDVAGDTKRAVEFSSLRPRHIAAARVASCPAWYGWESNVVYIQHDKEQVNVELSLVTQ